MKRRNGYFLLMLMFLIGLGGMLSSVVAQNQGVLGGVGGGGGGGGGGFAYLNSTSGMIITLTPGWNVVSTPASLSGISFSNGGNGINFFKLDSGQRVPVVASTGIITPLEGFLVKNSNNYNIKVLFEYKDVNPDEMLYQKYVNRGWNLLGITTLDNPFYSINPILSLDFTSNINSNLLNTIYIDSLAKNGTIDHPEIGEAYGIFLDNNDLYGGSNNRYLSVGVLGNKQDYSPIISVTPGSYNIPLLKGTIKVDDTVYFKNSGFFLEISGANANEDIAGYYGGGIIYDIIVNVGSCSNHINKLKYSAETDNQGYKKIYIPFFENCNGISEGMYDISVLIGINAEYAINFKTGMTITMSPINRSSFDGIYIDGEILPSKIEVSHNNLPNLEVSRDSIFGANIYSGPSFTFTLWSGVLYTNESGINANLLIDFDAYPSNYNDNLLYNKIRIDTFVDGVLVDTTGYNNRTVNYVIPLQENHDVNIEFKGTLTSYVTGYFVPKITVNKIIKDNINYITYNCDYYAGWCTQYNGGLYIMEGGLFVVNGGGFEDIGYCTAEEILDCLTGDNYDACIINCNYSQELQDAYEYAYIKGLTTAESINDAGMYNDINRITLANVLAKYAINVRGLTLDTSKICNIFDVDDTLDLIYGNGVKKLCQMGIFDLDMDNFFHPMFAPYSNVWNGEYGVLLAQILLYSRGDINTLSYLQSHQPCINGYVDRLEGEGIFDNNLDTFNKTKLGEVFLTLMRADEDYINGVTAGCSAEELLVCIGVDDYANCIAGCRENCSQNRATYSAELEDAYEYVQARGINTDTSIDNACMYGSLTRIAMAQMISNFAVSVLGLTPDTSATCVFTDVTAALDIQYGNGVTNACQLGLMGLNMTQFRRYDFVTEAEFGTILSRVLNLNSDRLVELNNSDPYYQKHLNFLNEQGIMTNVSNPYGIMTRGYAMLLFMRADDGYIPVTTECTAEELLACVTADDYDLCVNACNGVEESGCTAEELLACIRVDDYDACILSCSGE